MLSLSWVIEKWDKLELKRRRKNLLWQLRHDQRNRERAALELIKMGDAQSIGALSSALRHVNHTELRKEAKNWIHSYAFYNIGDVRTVGIIASQFLDDNDPIIRYQAALSLGKSGHDRAVEAIAGVLLDAQQPAKIRYEMASLLGQIGDVRAVEALLAALRDQGCYPAPPGYACKVLYVRECAAYQLREIIKKVGCVPPMLYGLLNDSDVFVKLSIASCLAAVQDPKAAGPLIELLIDANFSYQAKDDIKKIGSAAIPKLSELLKANPGHGWQIVSLLMDIGWTPADPLEKAWFLMVSGKWEEVTTLGAPAIELLRIVLVNTKIDMYLRQASAKSLEQLGWETQNREELINYLIVLERWGELVKIGSEITDALFAVCRSVKPGSSWRAGAMKTLGEIKAKRAVGFLSEILSEQSVSWDHSVAAEALLNIGDESAADAISNAFRRTMGERFVNDDADAYNHYHTVRDACVEALIGFAGENTITKVRDIICECGDSMNSCGIPTIDDKCASHFSWSLGPIYVADKGIEILERIGGPKSLEALNRLLTVRSQRVRSKAQQVLERLANSRP